MEAFVGTSGYSFKEWKGTFYPHKIKGAEMLPFYASHFNSVELNSTFYRLPRAETFQTWAQSVPDDFTFVVKASRRITHFSRLKNSEGASVEYLFRMASYLGTKLGPVLFQCPPSFAKDADRLREFLASIPANHPAVFEFRHASWVDDEVAGILRDAGACWCIAEDEEDQIEEVPMTATTNWGYFRLHREVYTKAQLELWVSRIQEMSDSWERVYLFFNHEAQGVKHAKDMAQLLK